MTLFVNDSIIVGVEEWLKLIPILGLNVGFEIWPLGHMVIEGSIESPFVKFGLNLAGFTDGLDVVGKGLGFDDVSKYWDGFKVIPILGLNVGSEVIAVVGFINASDFVGEVILDDGSDKSLHYRW